MKHETAWKANILIKKIADLNHVKNMLITGKDQRLTLSFKIMEDNYRTRGDVYKYQLPIKEAKEAVKNHLADIQCDLNKYEEELRKL